MQIDLSAGCRQVGSDKHSLSLISEMNGALFLFLRDGSVHLECFMGRKGAV